MLTDNEYLIAWGVYLLAVVGLAAVWWRMTRIISIRWLQNSIRVLFFALLVTPTWVVADSSRMAPAFMVWVLESTIVDSDNLSRVYAPLIVAAVVGLILGLVEAYLVRARKTD
ncbi:MAG: hypothetical protein CSA49_04195 [Gammaproteobacteria bacterium]|nr:MAG: hypothetical protein CSA49_04195 [Gammaproteobacteria bacterium]